MRAGNALLDATPTQAALHFVGVERSVFLEGARTEPFRQFEHVLPLELLLGGFC